MNGKGLTDSLNSSYGRRLKILCEISTVLSSSLDLDTVLKTLLERTDQLLPYDAASVSLYDRAHGKLEPVICRNLDMEDWKAGGGGLAKAIIERRVPLTSGDLMSQPREGNGEVFRGQGLTSFIGLPLMVADEVKGVLSFYTREQHEFDAEEIEFLAMLAAQAARAVQNCQRYSEVNQLAFDSFNLAQAYWRRDARLQNLTQQLTALHSVTTAASESLDLDTTLQEVMREITEIFKFNATRIFLLDPRRNELHLRASFETDSKLFAQRTVFQKGQGNVGTVAATGKPLIYENVQHDPQYERLSYTKIARQGGFGFCAGFPIRTKLTTLGVIYCLGVNPRCLRAGEVQLITLMANQIAIGVQYAARFEESRAQAREVSLLQHVAKVINQSLDLKTLLCGVMREVRKLFKFDIGRISLLEANGEDITVLADEGRLRNRVPPGSAFVKKVLEIGRPVFFEDIANDSLYKKWSVKKIALKEGFGSAFYIPIKSKHQHLGAIAFLSKRVHRFSRSEIRLLFSITHHLSTAVENAQLYEAVRCSREQLRGLAQRLQVAREEERAKVAREVHDDLGQLLTALKMELGRCAAVRGSDMAKPWFALIDPMLDTVRNIAAGLRPAVLDDLGLTEALEWQAEAFQRRTGIRCQVASRVKEDCLAPSHAVAVFRIFQEALSNVERHAGADEVKVEWKRDAGDLLLRVSDNGSGIKQSALTDPSSFGILGMKERALVCGGNLDISGIPGKGTTVSLRIPAE